MCVTPTNMLLKFHIYKFVMCKYQASISTLCASYELTAINNVTKSTGTNSPHITIIYPEQVCLPHCTHMFHCTANVVCIQNPKYYIKTQKQEMQLLFPMPFPFIYHTLPYMCHQQTCPLKCQIYTIYAN